jgi:galactitol-specific phosphotransferase system IIB component
MTDGEWGLTYRLDPATVPRETRKRYAIEEAKQDLQDYLDLQISLQESASSRTEAGKRPGYSEMFRLKKIEMEEGTILEGGHIAERLVRNILRKLSIDHGADFSITRVDAHQDMEHKIDFVIRRKQTERGVSVREDEHVIGIQFTTDSRPGTITRKERQIAKAKTRLEPGDRIQDIVLVVIPLKHPKRLYEGWKAEGSLPGGPDALWLAETKRKILRGVLKGFVSDEDIERYCGLVKEKETNPFRKTETA